MNMSFLYLTLSEFDWTSSRVRTAQAEHLAEAKGERGIWMTLGKIFPYSINTVTMYLMLC